MQIYPQSKFEVISNVERDGRNLKEYGVEIRNDRDVVLSSVKNYGRSLEYASETMKNNKEIVFEAVKNDQKSFEFASEDLRSDKEFILKILKWSKLNIHRKLERSAFEFVSEKLNQDRNFIMEAISIDEYVFRYASSVLRNDKEVVLEAVKQSGLIFQYASEELKNEKEFVTEIVKCNGSSLKYASPELKNDKEVVLEAVISKGHSLYYASEELKNDREVVLEAIRQNGILLDGASNELRNDKEIVIEAVKRFPFALEDASEEMRNNKEVVLEAVKQDGWCLELASKELRNDKQIVLEAMKQNVYSIFCAGDEMKKDKEILFSRKYPPREKDISTFNFNGMLDLYRQPNECKNNYSCGENKDLERYLGKVEFKNLSIHQLLGRGAFGGTYLCSFKLVEEKSSDYEFYLGNNDPLVNYIDLVVKIYNDPFLESEKKDERLSKDALYIPYHHNVVTILKHCQNETIDLFKLPDYESYWKETVLGIRHVKNCGAIFMRHHKQTLKEYVEKRTVNYKGTFSTHEVHAMVWGLLSGICHFQKHMIVHRDLHDKNIFVEPGLGRILIGDFGCALDLRENPGKFKVEKKNDVMFSFTSHTYFKKEHSGELVGFVKHGGGGVAPEILNFDPLKDDVLDYEKSDIFSIGVLGMKLLDFMIPGEFDYGLMEFVTRMTIVDAKKRMGCYEAVEKARGFELLGVFAYYMMENNKIQKSI